VTRRIAVVGGCGFIGSRLGIAMSAAGNDVTVLDVAPPPPDLAASCRVETCDVTVPGSLRGALEDADAVYLAAALLAKQCGERPGRAWAVNVAGTSHVLSEIVAAGRRPHVVFLSTGTVYASPAARYPVPEDAQTTARDLYTASKLAAEQIVASAAAAGSFPATLLRLFTVYGPGPASGRRGHFVAGWLERAAADLPLRISGDGTQTIDLTHVDDVVAACRVATSLPGVDGACRVFNVGSGTETRVRDVARWMREVVPSLTVVRVPPRWSAPARQFGDIRRASAELGYSPAVQPEAGIKSLLRERTVVAAAHG
jgi:nucleoside-diphosphate-sugar epimerase